MHCVNFFGTNDYAWIEEFNIKDYKEFKETFQKSKQSKQMTQAVEAIEKYLKTKDTDGGSVDVKEEFDSLVSEPAEKKTAKKGGVKKTESRKREANDSDSSASGPSSTSPSKRVKVTAKAKETKEIKKEEPSSLFQRRRVDMLLDQLTRQYPHKHPVAIPAPVAPVSAESEPAMSVKSEAVNSVVSGGKRDKAGGDSGPPNKKVKTEQR